MVTRGCGAPETIRTSGLNIRSVALYPTELRAHKKNLPYRSSGVNLFGPDSPDPGPCVTFIEVHLHATRAAPRDPLLFETNGSFLMGL